MTIKGGIVAGRNDVELSISIAGGKSYKRVYNDVVSVAINKFVIISTTLCKILISNSNSRDIKFYSDQIKLLLRRAHVELIPGDLPFQHKYNMWLLDGYIRMLLETSDMKLIAQMLDLDSILYSIEEAGSNVGVPTFIEFDLPEDLKIKTVMDIDSTTELSTPINDEISAYLHSINNNLMLLTSLIIANKSVLIEIHKKIISTASTYLS